MKTQFITLVIGSVLLLATASLHAEETNSAPSPTPFHTHIDKPRAVHLVPPGIAEKLDLTDDQKAKIKVIEEGFAETQQEYLVTHKDELAAARQAMSKAMAGLQEQRKAAEQEIKSLLTEEQIQRVQASAPDKNNAMRIPFN